MTLQWSYAGCSATEFVVEVSLQPEFLGITTNQTFAGTEREWRDLMLDCGGPYWFRVGVKFDSRVVDSWSDPTSFTMGC